MLGFDKNIVFFTRPSEDGKAREVDFRLETDEEANLRIKREKELDSDFFETKNPSNDEDVLFNIIINNKTILACDREDAENVFSEKNSRRVQRSIDQTVDYIKERVRDLLEEEYRDWQYETD